MKTIAKTQYTIKNYALHLNIYVSYIDKLLLLMSGCPLGHLEYDVNFWLILLPLQYASFFVIILGAQKYT